MGNCISDDKEDVGMNRNASKFEAVGANVETINDA